MKTQPVIIMLVMLAAIASFWVGGITALSALRDADTCWLLALGKIIATGGMPESDPFSFTYYFMTTTGTAPPFVMHQWLSELLFYEVFGAGGLAALVYLVSAITTITFTAAPALALRWAKVNPGLCVLIGSLAQLAASIHFFARPELFSYPLFALAFYLVSLMLKQSKSSHRWLLLAVYGVLSALWCNLHSSFVLAITLSFLPAAATLAAKSARKDDAVLFALPIVSILATLLNPAGLKLWTYLPGLFFMKIAINETRSLGLADLGTVELYPFFVLLVLYLASLIISRSKLEGAQLAASVLAAIFACALAFSRIRLIVYTLLIIAFELPYLLSLIAPAMQKENSTEKEALLAPLLTVLACLAGTFFVSTSLSSPKLPQPMPGFKPPFKAIKYLETHPQKGPVLNDARFGDMMIWYLSKPSPVFIDTRFDMYGDDFFSRYAMLNNCEAGWRKALSDYAIEWVFLPPDRPLAKALAQDPGWKTVFSDDTAVILTKQPQGPASP